MAEKKKFITPQNFKDILAGVLKTATQTVKGLMSAADKTNLDKSIKNITYFMQGGGAGLTLTKNDGTESSLGLPVAGSTVNGLMSIADKIKLDGIASEANKYVHPTTAGNKHIPAGGSSGQVLGWNSNGTAKWVSLLPVLKWKEKKTVPKGTGGSMGNTVQFNNANSPCLLLITGAYSVLYYINFALESKYEAIVSEGSEEFRISRNGSGDFTVQTSLPYDHTAYLIDIVTDNCP